MGRTLIRDDRKHLDARSRDEEDFERASLAAEPLRQFGAVKFWNDDRGFGFISREEKADIFVHRSGIRGYRQALSRPRLNEGDLVSFVEGRGRKDRLQAEDVAWMPD